jgi:Methyltransferase FkbM domain
MSTSIRVTVAAATLLTVVAGGAMWWSSAGDTSQGAGARDPDAQRRQLLWDALQPMTLADCELARYGEAADGGYLLCGNLLAGVSAAYSYGISGYDGWGCQMATERAVPVHQYDCFDTRRPVCAAPTVFHEECIGTAPATIDGRRFDSLDRQVAANGHADDHIVMKIDVEGAEWDVFLTTSDSMLERIDQLVVEFHGTGDRRFLRAVTRLAQYFHVANLHMNNHACQPGNEPFAAWAYEVLFVNKRLATVSGPRTPPWHALDHPNAPALSDCQSPLRR